MERGLFITFEGGEGSGKTTQSERLAARLDAMGIRSVWTKEPGGIPETVPIRQALLYPPKPLGRMAEIILFEADRIIHVPWINAQLEAGFHVICDRFVDSTLAYQGYGRGHGIWDVKQFNKVASQGLVPDVTYYNKVDPEIGVARALERKDANTTFDEEKMPFHYRVSGGFDAIAKEDKNRVVVVDASPDPDTIEEFIWDDFSRRLERR